MSQPSKPARAATPVLLSPTAKNLWRNGRLIRPQSNYGEWSAMISNERGVVFIDAFRLIADCYEKLGHETVQPLFCSAAEQCPHRCGWREAERKVRGGRFAGRRKKTTGRRI